MDKYNSPALAHSEKTQQRLHRDFQNKYKDCTTDLPNEHKECTARYRNHELMNAGTVCQHSGSFNSLEIV
jgi:hypothetical protein